MKFVLPTLKNIIKIIVIAFVLAVITYLLAMKTNIASIDPVRLLTYGVLGGGIIVGILAATQFEFTLGQKQVSIFIGNLAFKATAKDLRDLFSDYGEVLGVRVMTDRATRRPKGFAFVEMDKKAAKAAIADLDGSEFFGRDIKVNYATRKKRTS